MSGEVSGHEPEVKESDMQALRMVVESMQKEFSAIKEENKTLKETIEADRMQRSIDLFESNLKPGYKAKSRELYAEMVKDPGSWVPANADKFIQVKETKLAGNAITEGAGSVFDLEKKQNELFGRAVV
jgi:hypothetical protein